MGGRITKEKHADRQQGQDSTVLFRTVKTRTQGVRPPATRMSLSVALLPPSPPLYVLGGICEQVGPRW